jgi:hypothetical protein
MDSPVKTPSTIKTTKSNVELELLLKHEISKIKKQMFAERCRSEELAEMSPSPTINSYSKLLALKVVERERDAIEKLAVPRCFLSIKKDVESAKTRQETPEDRIRKRSLSPFVTSVAFATGCDVQKL